MSLIRRCCVCKLIMGLRECAEVGVTDGFCPECARDMICGEPDAGLLAQAEFRADQDREVDARRLRLPLQPRQFVAREPDLVRDVAGSCGVARLAGAHGGECTDKSEGLSNRA